MLSSEALVAKELDDYTLVINKGSKDGVENEQRFQIYSMGEEIFDPETKESLGKVEIIKGTGKVVHVQERIATLRSDMKTPPAKTIKTIKKGRSLLPIALATAYASLSAPQEIEEYLTSERIPFSEAEVNDHVRPI